MVVKSVASTLAHYQGHWRYQGPTLYAFDEVDLRIEGKIISLTQKHRGQLVKTREWVNQGHFMEDFLVFYQAGTTDFFVRNATEERMLCGEMSITGMEQVEWWLEVQRVR